MQNTTLEISILQKYIIKKSTGDNIFKTQLKQFIQFIKL